MTDVERGQHHDRVEEAFFEYQQLLDSGEPIDREAFLSQYADIADSLAGHLAAEATIREMAGPTFADETAHGNLEATLIGTHTDATGAGTCPEEATIVEDTVTSTAAGDTQAEQPLSTRGEMPETFGRYRLKRRLGEGAMGAVYLAHDTQLDRPVALKIPKFEAAGSDELVARFLREARAVATLHHPNICPVYDVGEIDGQTFLSMGYVEGRPLSDYAKSKKRQGERSVAKFVRKLALALAEAHRIGVVHRDLKPGNVMVAKNGEPVVMDFGLAVRLGSEDVRVTRSGTIVGTPAYMSPEQVEGDPTAVGPASDQYSLGVILYEMLTGRLPFQGTVLSVIGQIAHTEAPALEALREDVDPRLAAICRRMMSKNSADRFADMAEAAEALDRYLVESKQGVEPGTSLWDVEVGGESPPPHPNRRTTRAKRPSGAKQEGARKGGSTGGGWRTLLAVAAPLAAIAVAVILLIPTPDGVVRVEIEDPDITVEFRGDTLTFDDSGTRIEVKPGEHTLFVKRGGLSFTTDEFTVDRDGETVIRVTWQDGELLARRGDVTLGSRWEQPSRGSQPPLTDTANWRPIFDGKSLSGWEAFGGKPDDWRVEEGILVGTGAGNRLVYTREKHTDLRLRAECRLSARGNSGIIVRARADNKINGYEAQLAFPDSPGRSNTNVGGVWKYGSFNGDVVRPGEWFEIEIEAVGSMIRVWVNGQSTVAFPDDTFVEGHVALQGWQAGTKVEFRRIEVVDPSRTRERIGSPGTTPANDTRTALAFDGEDDYVEFPTLVYKGEHPVTAEMYVTVEPFAANPGSSCFHFPNQAGFHLSEDQSVADVLYTPPGERTSVGGTRLVRGARTHLALAWSEKTLSFFVNGRRVSRRDIPLDPDPEHGRPTRLGGGFGPKHFKGTIDEVRISKVARYDEDFEPAKRFESDEHTLALYHVDEGQGTVLRDASGNGHHGEIHGATWVVPPQTEPRSKLELVRKLDGHLRQLHSVAWSPNGRWVASAGMDRRLLLWDTSTWTIAHEFPDTAHDKAVICLAIAPDSKTIACGDAAGKIVLWDLESHERRHELLGHETFVTDVVFTPDGRFLFSTSNDSTLRRWNVETGEQVAKHPTKSQAEVLAVTADGAVGLTVGEFVQKWNLTGEGRPITFPDDGGRITSLVLTRDGKRFVTGEADGRVLVRDLATGAVEHTIPFQSSAVESLAVSPAGRWLYVGSFDRTLRIVDLTTGELVLDYEEPSHCVNYLALSPDGRQLVTGGGHFIDNGKYTNDGDFALRLWRLPEFTEPRTGSRDE